MRPGKRVKSLSALKGKKSTAVEDAGAMESDVELLKRASKVAADIRVSLTPVSHTSQPRSRLRPRSVVLSKPASSTSPTVAGAARVSPFNQKALASLRSKKKSPLERLLVSSALLAPVLRPLREASN